MIQVKEFVDTDKSFAEKRANDFLAELREDQVVNVCYGSVAKPTPTGTVYPRSAILIVYKTEP